MMLPFILLCAGIASFSLGIALGGARGYKRGRQALARDILRTAGDRPLYARIAMEAGRTL